MLFYKATRVSESELDRNLRAFSGQPGFDFTLVNQFDNHHVGNLFEYDGRVVHEGLSCMF